MIAQQFNKVDVRSRATYPDVGLQEKNLQENGKENTTRKNRTVIIICSFIVAFFVLLPISFLFKQDPGFAKALICLLLFPIFLYLIYLVVYSVPPLFILLFSNNARSDNREIARMEIKYQKESKRLIIKKLGLLAYYNFSGGVNRGLNSGYDYCKTLLLRQSVESDVIIKFHVVMRLYKCSIIDEKYNRAVDYLKMALKLKPNEFLVNYWLAETNELIGNAEKAISIYQNIVTNCTNISDSLKEYLNVQIERVKTTGPKAPSPMPGLKYMSY